jgi:hypothetical protein
VFTTRRLPLYLKPDEGGGGGEGLAPEGAPETAANTPEGTGTVEQQPVQENWEERYKEAQRWGTQSAQEAAGLREKAQLIDDWNSGDPAAQKRAAEALGILLQEEEEEALEAQTEAGLSAEDRQLLEEFRQERTTQQQTQAEQQQYAGYRTAVDPDIAAMGVPEGIRDAVADYALHNLPGVPCPPSAQYPKGLKPDLDGAVEAIKSFVLAGVDMPDVQKHAIEKYRQTKRAPGISSTGAAGTQVPNLDDRQQRVDWIVQQALAAED